MADPRDKKQPVKRDIQLGFDTDTITLQLEQIMPLKIVSDAARTSRKFRQIVTSIKEIGIIEPPVVARDSSSRNRYLLLDGHLRLEALKQAGETEVTCLVSTDDEAFTYNRHVSRLSSIQEHRMIARAVERGVSEEKIAQALDVNVKIIIMKKNMLDGICPEVINLLKDKMVSHLAFPILRKVVQTRQIEMAALMNDSGVYTGSYAKALLAATPKNQLTDPEKSKKIRGLSDEQMERMENEMASLQREYRLIEESYGIDNLNLTVAKGYLTSLLGNAKIVRYLAQAHPEILAQFQKIAEMTSIGGKDATA